MSRSAVATMLLGLLVALAGCSGDDSSVPSSTAGESSPTSPSTDEGSPSPDGADAPATPTAAPSPSTPTPASPSAVTKLTVTGTAKAKCNFEAPIGSTCTVTTLSLQTTPALPAGVALADAIDLHATNVPLGGWTNGLSMTSPSTPCPTQVQLGSNGFSVYVAAKKEGGSFCLPAGGITTQDFAGHFRMTASSIPVKNTAITSAKTIDIAVDLQIVP